MRSRLVRVQLIVFAVIAVLAVGYGSFAYAGLQRFTGIGTYTITVELADGSGLYKNALVTYRGVDVGVVTGVDLRPDGALALLQVKSAFKIPDSARASVRSVSAAGEQFIDLVPEGAGDGDLHDGSRIVQDRSIMPVAASEVIKKVNKLLRAVPKEDLSVVVDEVSTAVNGAGDDLNLALRSSNDLIRQASAKLVETTQLIVDADPLLTAVVRSGPDLSRALNNLASFTGQLAMSDNDLRHVLDSGPGALDTVAGLFSDLSKPLPTLLADLQSVGEVMRVNVDGIRHILVVYPAIATSVKSIHDGFQDPSDRTSGQGELDIKLGDTQNTPACTVGYGMQRRNPDDLSPAPVKDAGYCDTRPSDVRVARGARNLPCATDPSVRTAEVSRCPQGRPSTWPQLLSRPSHPYTPSSQQNDDEPVAVPYDTKTRHFRAPNGKKYTLGRLFGSAPTSKEIKSWQELFPR